MNNYPFNDLEGLRIAEEMERRGEEFYRRAVRVSKSDEAVELLSALAEDEKAHREEFARLTQAARARIKDGEVRAYAGEESAYLSALAAEIVFPDGLMKLGRDHGFESPKAILNYAIASEKDSILYYTEMALLSEDENARSAFIEIVRQEKNHLSKLQKALMERG